MKLLLVRLTHAAHKGPGQSPPQFPSRRPRPHQAPLCVCVCAWVHASQAQNHPSGCCPGAGWAQGPRHLGSAAGRQPAVLSGQTRTRGLSSEHMEQDWGSPESCAVAVRLPAQTTRLPGVSPVLRTHRRRVSGPRMGATWEHGSPCLQGPSPVYCPVRLPGWGGPWAARRPRLACPLVWQPKSAGAELPCKYPRFTRFMTSLAVKFATSSTEHTGRGTDRNRERERSASSVRRPAQRAGQPAARQAVHSGTGRGQHQPSGKQVCHRQRGLLLCQALGRVGGCRG